MPPYHRHSMKSSSTSQVFQCVLLPWTCRLNAITVVEVDNKVICKSLRLFPISDLCFS